MGLIAISLSSASIRKTCNGRWDCSFKYSVSDLPTQSQSLHAKTRIIFASFITEMFPKLFYVSGYKTCKCLVVCRGNKSFLARRIRSLFHILQLYLGLLLYMLWNNFLHSHSDMGLTLVKVINVKCIIINACSYNNSRKK